MNSPKLLPHNFEYSMFVNDVAIIKKMFLMILHFTHLAKEKPG